MVAFLEAALIGLRCDCNYNSDRDPMCHDLSFHFVLSVCVHPGDYLAFADLKIAYFSSVVIPSRDLAFLKPSFL